MAKKNNTTADLRNHLFEQIARLNDPQADLQLELEKAKALASIGTVIVNSVKIETDFLRVTGGKMGGDNKELGNGE